MKLVLIITKFGKYINWTVSFSPQHKQSTQYYHIYTIRSFLSYITMWGTLQALWVDQYSVWGGIDCALNIECIFVILVVTQITCSAYLSFCFRVLGKDLQQTVKCLLKSLMCNRKYCFAIDFTCHNVTHCRERISAL